jgi:hypothetical protein
MNFVLKLSRPLFWLTELGLSSILITALFLLLAATKNELLPRYPGSARLMPCGTSGIATGAQSPTRDADTFYLYTQTCFVTIDSSSQVNAWYNQRGWQNLSQSRGTFRIASVDLGLFVLHFQQTAFARAINGSTQINAGFVLSGHQTWP